MGSTKPDLYNSSNGQTRSSANASMSMTPGATLALSPNVQGSYVALRSANPDAVRVKMGNRGPFGAAKSRQQSYGATSNQFIITGGGESGRKFKRSKLAESMYLPKDTSAEEEFDKMLKFHHEKVDPKQVTTEVLKLCNVFRDKCEMHRSF